MTDVLKAFIEENFSNENLVIVSNREPYIHKKTESGYKIDRPAGGLTSAMDDVLQATGGTWVAWGSGSGDRDMVDTNDSLMVPPGHPLYRLKRVWLKPSIADNYYNGYSNQVLWPLCHNTLDRVSYRKKFWHGYKQANQLFADAVLEMADDDSIIWIHDYHLCLVPALIREKRPELTVAHFWHIPWPDWSVFRTSPQAAEIITGLLGNDLIGFQIPLFANNFLACAKETLGADVDYNAMTVTYNGHVTKMKSFPISIDYKKFETMASSPKIFHSMRTVKKRYSLPQYVGIGVDRLEYTKALIKRMQAFELFFERYRQFRGKFTFIQVAVPTRLEEPYLSYKKSVEGMIERINKSYGTDTWKPIVYITDKIEHNELAVFYRMADMAVISSVYDGMNLVAKEYIACQVDRNGVLILSEFAGAAEELMGAILVNPYDTEVFAQSIRQAIKMSDSEKRARMSILKSQVADNNIYKWILNILRELVSMSSSKHMRCDYLFEHWKLFSDKIKKGQIFLFLDFDGTLVPIVDSPDKAAISPDIRDILSQLRKYIPISIVSGRGLQDIRARVGLDGIIYAGNHGAEIWDGVNTMSQYMDNDRLILQQCLSEMSEKLSHIRGVLLEDKDITASIHFRNVQDADLPEFFQQFTSVSEKYSDKLRIVSGKKVFELRPPKIWHKGNAVEWVMSTHGNNKLPIYIGDDTTDEDAFRVLHGNGISISIGGCSEADFYLKEQGEIMDILQKLLFVVKK